MMDDRLISVVLWIMGVSAIAWRWPGLRGTTLLAPVVWVVIALTTVAALALIAPLPASTEPEKLTLRWHWYLAATSTFCPPMALFGAKRPQHGPWQFIVISLWLVLLLPAIDFGTARGGGTAVGLHPAQAWFLAGLVFMAASNYLPTRFAVSSLLFTSAQVCLLLGFQPLTIPLALSVGAILMVCLQGTPPRTVPPLDRVWLDFRDAFGVVWGLRVQQRVNQSAEMHGWNARLNWHGFTSRDGGSISPQTEKALRNSLNNVLRRFVSPKWIADRLGEALS